ncbi:hypothetical protein SAMN06265368_3196 [Cohaesibacter gelatinilyticus]|uniref:Uncharacterized protein n=1 Tax=Cohaesibacter gelatinilyticus TaxID=372072 RepID=A0A285PFR4_9HYPH|nr:hypothetical protein SAMN06265368_3196 [Cohaesibacter gelatinilyticus]
MENPPKWQPLTVKDLDEIRQDLVKDAPKIKLARTFLTMTGGAAKANLNPELLLRCGEQLSDPEALLSSLNILIWQNQRRKKGAFRQFLKT